MTPVWDAMGALRDSNHEQHMKLIDRDFEIMRRVIALETTVENLKFHVFMLEIFVVILILAVAFSLIWIAR